MYASIVIIGLSFVNKYLSFLVLCVLRQQAKPLKTKAIHPPQANDEMPSSKRTERFRFSSKFRKLAFLRRTHPLTQVVLTRWGRQASTGACIDL